jgi:hypothetical protein
MVSPFRRAILMASFAVLAAAVGPHALPVEAQQPAPRQARTFDGKPNLNGIWQAMNTSDWDLLAHAAAKGRDDLGALGATPPGLSVVEGNEIPYLPAALTQRKQNYEKRMTDDPIIKCYMPGVPRATYLPFPLPVPDRADAHVDALRVSVRGRVARRPHEAVEAAAG